MRWFWPIRTGKTLFDVWFVVHACFWVVAGSTFAAFNLPLPVGLGIMVVIAGAWEGFERHAEKRWPKIWKHQEGWVNAYVSDIGLAGVGGTWAGYLLYGAQ